jgi:hypothetical protein
MLKRFVATACVATSLVAVSARAEPPRKPLEVQSSFGADDAVKGQAYIRIAMAAPMPDLAKAATATNPTAMLEYGLALQLGRPSASAMIDRGETEKLKRGFRAMIDAYLNSADRFDGVKFNEDSMLDHPDFWIALAEHIGRPKQHVDNAIIAADAQAMIPPGMGLTASAPTYMPDDQQSEEFNLGQDLILDRQVVNAAWACAQSARSFARLKKVQLLDVSATRMTPEQFADAKTGLIDVYRVSYQEGVLACGARDFFFQVADIAAANLGKLGALKEDPNATLASLPAVPEPQDMVR